VRLFEIATLFRKAAKGNPPHEETHLAGVITGRLQPPHWSRQDESIMIWDLKALLEIAAHISYSGAAQVTVEQEVLPGFEEGRGFAVSDAEGLRVGYGGLVSSSEINTPVWAGDIWGFEITLPSDPEEVPPAIHVPLPIFPAIERDLALVVPGGTTAANVESLIQGCGEGLLESIEIFDLYLDTENDRGFRSLAFRLRFRAMDRTLKDKEVDKSVDLILRKLKEELNVEPRK
jgi:phenylalanyl-tRNA synthetase beta chain